MSILFERQLFTIIFLSIMRSYSTWTWNEYKLLKRHPIFGYVALCVLCYVIHLQPLSSAGLLIPSLLNERLSAAVRTAPSSYTLMKLFSWGIIWLALARHELTTNNKKWAYLLLLDKYRVNLGATFRSSGDEWYDTQGDIKTLWWLSIFLV